MKTDILIVGGGTGGVAAALSAAARGKRVVLTEETDMCTCYALNACNVVSSSVVS